MFYSDLYMPYSGTYIPIGRNKYLLFNSSRYHDQYFSLREGTPFPIKLSIDCTDKLQLNKQDIINELIAQVYSFSRLYWKSLSQQSLPVTVSYPALIAETAPHFKNGIPAEGANKLWFL